MAPSCQTSYLPYDIDPAEHAENIRPAGYTLRLPELPGCTSNVRHNSGRFTEIGSVNFLRNYAPSSAYVKALRWLCVTGLRSWPMDAEGDSRRPFELRDGDDAMSS